MRSRSLLSFRAARLRVEDPPSHGALLTAFLSSLSLDEKSGCAVLYGAAVRHFLHWLERHRTAIRTIDDQVVRRFEKHRCRCHRYSAQQAHYKADQAARVRRFVRFLEDQGYVEVDDGIDDLPRHLADYSDAIDHLQLAQGPAQSYRSEAEHVVAWLRIARRRWADIDDTIIDQYAVHDCRCPVWRKRGKLVPTGTKRRRRCARHFVEFLRGRGAIPLVEPVADDNPHMSAYLAWLKQHRGATDETIRRYRTDIRRLMPMLGEPSQWDAAGLRSAFQRRSK